MKFVANFWRKILEAIAAWRQRRFLRWQRRQAMKAMVAEAKAQGKALRIQASAEAKARMLRAKADAYALKKHVSAEAKVVRKQARMHMTLLKERVERMKSRRRKEQRRIRAQIWAARRQRLKSAFLKPFRAAGHGIAAGARWLGRGIAWPFRQGARCAHWARRKLAQIQPSASNIGLVLAILFAILTLVGIAIENPWVATLAPFGVYLSYRLRKFALAGKLRAEWLQMLNPPLSAWYLGTWLIFLIARWSR